MESLGEISERKGKISLKKRELLGKIREIVREVAVCRNWFTFYRCNKKEQNPEITHKIS